MPLKMVEPPALSGPNAEIESRSKEIVEKQKLMHESAEVAWAAWVGFYNGYGQILCTVGIVKSLEVVG